MPWKSIVGHDRIVEQLRQAVRRGRLAHAYLFAGPEGIGKKRFARTLAQALLCSRRRPEDLDPCQECPDCKQVASGVHPDFFLVQKPEDRHEMPIELFVGSGDRRGREGLCYDLSLKPARGRHKIAIIDDADWFNDESANCLLKTLEEPPPRSLLILIGTHPELQLPTVRSRCVVLHFSPLSTEQVEDLLVAQEAVADHKHAKLLASLSEGSVSRAYELSDEELWRFRRRLLEELAQGDFVAPTLAQEVQEFVESAGSDTARQRARAQVIVGFCIQFYRRVLRELCRDGNGESPNESEQKAVKTFSDRLATQGHQPEAIEHLVGLIERCLEADYHIQRRVQLALALEALFDDLAQIPSPSPAGKR